MSLSEYISGRITLAMQSDLRLTFVSPKSKAVKTGGPALTGFGLYRAGPKSLIEKRA